MADTATVEPEVADAEIVDDDAPTNGTALVRVSQPQEVNLWHSTDPIEVVTEATRVADALKDVVTSKGLIANIRGREHPQVEAWQTLGAMLGVYAIPKGDPAPLPWPEPTPESLEAFRKRGLTFGFTAAYRVEKHGLVVGGGESRCTRSESTWKDRDDFALASMAQTRATSKALSGPLRFVMSLAGYQTTPAEEMPAGADAEELAALRARVAQFEQQGPWGLQMTKPTAGRVGLACRKLASGSSDGGRGFFQQLKAQLGVEAMPEAAALALVAAADKIDAVPFDPEYRDPTGDIPDAAQASEGPAQGALARQPVTQVTEAMLTGLSEEVIDAWIAAGVSEAEAKALAQGLMRKRTPEARWNSLQGSLTQAQERIAQRKAVEA